MITEGKAVVVTGCSSGLGRFTAHLLKAKGWRVIATVRRPADAENLRQDGCESVELDLGSSASIRAAAEQILEATGGVLAGLVNNAGVELLGAIEDLSRDDLRLCFETNVFGTFELTNRFIPTFRRQRGGRIVFVSASNSNGFGYPFLGPGNASKSALEVLATTLKRELRHTGISVSTVCPGELPTSLLRKMLGYSAHVLDRDTTVHGRAYASFAELFARPHAEPTADQLQPVAATIARLLTSERPRRRVVVPLSAKLHYLGHALLPEWAQDLLLFRKMRRSYGIDL
jgi:NAD(P)-dependent dehydrogenase (short-subunit alcohol dehydrogenase family)